MADNWEAPRRPARRPLGNVLTVPDTSWGSRRQVPARGGLAPWGALTHWGPSGCRGERETLISDPLTLPATPEAWGQSSPATAREPYFRLQSLGTASPLPGGLIPGARRRSEFSLPGAAAQETSTRYASAAPRPGSLSPTPRPPHLPGAPRGKDTRGSPC